MDEILVSINCITYNHEEYIEKAIEGFLMQKTNFKYEVLIHDDASTDKTAEVIRGYEKRFPDIIKPIYQIENQYSKGVKVGCLNRERAKGKYIAECEGDDYWADPYKLQKQVDYMEGHPECSVCVHAAIMIHEKTKKIIGKIRPSQKTRNFTIDEVIEGGGGLFSTNSMLYRSIYIESIPKFYKNAPVGDYPLMIYLAICGHVYYLDETMSVYRTGVKGSWTSIAASSNVEKLISIYNQINKMLDEVDEFTKHEHSEIIRKTKLQYMFHILLLKEGYKEIKTGECKVIYEALNKKEKLKIYIKQYFPYATKVLKTIKKSVLNEQ